MTTATKKFFAIVIEGRVWSVRSTVRGNTYTHASLLHTEDNTRFANGFHGSEELARKGGASAVAAQWRAYKHRCTFSVVPVVEVRRGLKTGDMIKDGDVI